MTLPVHVRWMIRRDMEEVLDIEQGSFESCWDEGDFARALRVRNCIGMISEHGEKVVGFMIYELHKSKLLVLNFAVHPAFRHMDIGTQMIDKLKSKLSTHRRRFITLHLRETNLPAQLFFKSQGFEFVKLERGFYEDTDEDAYLMRHTFEDPEESMPANRVASYFEEA